jgi:hypothetical protein
MSSGVELFDRLVASGRMYARSVNQRYHSRNLRRETNGGGLDFLAQDWDTLALLDGCRYDTFAEENTLPGELSAKQSRGGTTVEFLRGNVAGRELHDTVYVTANGQYDNHREELDAEFHHVENIWRHDDAWSDEYHTVLPEVTTDYALRAAERFPNKRLLVHYIQPHYPFLEGPIEVEDAFDPETPDFWRQVYVGESAFDASTLREAYVSNLRRALPHVRRLVDELSGRTVVTSDHGNLLGDRTFPVPVREWGHPRLLWDEQLTTVPWLVDTTGQRPDIEPEPPTTGVTLGEAEEPDSPADDERLAEHLRDLGYKQ